MKSRRAHAETQAEHRGFANSPHVAGDLVDRHTENLCGHVLINILPSSDEGELVMLAGEREHDADGAQHRSLGIAIPLS